MDPIAFQTSTFARCIILAVYVNDILVNWNDIVGITLTSTSYYLGSRHSKAFLGIKFAYRMGNLVINQWKYVLDILLDVKLSGLVDSKPNFSDSTSPLLANVHAYRPNITYTVGLLIQIMHAPQEIH